MTRPPVKKVVIAGGGTAGWCAAAALSKMIGPLIEVTLVESDEIGIIGVGEATVPTIRTFHHLLGIDEREFMRATNASIKLGISFDNWARKGDHYFHSFGVLGKSSWMAPFHHIWLQAKADGVAGPLSDYCFELQAAENGKFETSPTSRINYAYHFDTGLYGPFLRRLSEAAGVTRVEGKIARVDQNPDTGDITALMLESGQSIAGDLFIDCTGLRGLLIEGTLKSGYEDWNHWLSNDSAIAMQTEPTGKIVPYTQAIAHDAGWHWRIPLQNRVGQGHVYSSAHMSDDQAMDSFMATVGAPALTKPRTIKYRTGRRLKIWNKNCIAMGLSSGFIEPLESTNIHLMQIAATRLVQLFPFDGITDALINRFNKLTEDEVVNIRDFVIMHYKLTERDDTPYWRERRDMAIPDTLTERIEMFRDTGHAWQVADEVFRIDSWLQVMTGQRLEPKSWHHLGRMMSTEQSGKALAALKAQIDQAVAAMPEHGDFLKAYCALPEPV
ncbi:tryptophan halogenase family protein [Asticcacaulis machinosus]|uniref:Tryptophan 7-halogenase n=1 Tax=Asticcacaulis machinosus TaxID=2984211 RepID=A0ABT5HNV7_9CAUL|nr:tryptophan halogenase family protein [Asticcacaulis machinosus]MDC7677708.1 tryptophan 7-halogenase [Asticcacaulis machinosus]